MKGSKRFEMMSQTEVSVRRGLCGDTEEDVIGPGRERENRDHVIQVETYDSLSEDEGLWRWSRDRRLAILETRERDKHITEGES